jgi:hypothetical protein
MAVIRDPDPPLICPRHDFEANLNGADFQVDHWRNSSALHQSRIDQVHRALAEAGIEPSVGSVGDS